MSAKASHDVSPEEFGEFLTAEEVCKLFRMSRTKLNRLIADSHNTGFPYMKTGIGKFAHVLFVKKDIVNWMKLNTLEHKQGKTNLRVSKNTETAILQIQQRVKRGG